ncbi:MAG TPA: hypothetical protein VIL60_09795 [Rhodanobacter sp.]
MLSGNLMFDAASTIATGAPLIVAAVLVAINTVEAQTKATFTDVR